MARDWNSSSVDWVASRKAGAFVMKADDTPRRTKPCPLCGAGMEKHTSTISEPVMTGYGQVTRKARPATFFACTQCEHCEEQ